MEKNNNKIITVCFVIAGLLSALVIEMIVKALATQLPMVAQFNSQPAVQHILPVAVGVLTFLILQFNRKIWVWADECVTEVRKVVWPSRKDTTAMTMVVCMMLMTAGVFFGLYDLISGEFIKLIVK